MYLAHWILYALCTINLVASNMIQEVGMKAAIIVTFSLLTLSLAMADVYVESYTKKDGTPVSSHYRSDPNSTKSDNYSTKGNVNPYTGKKGYK